MVVAMGDLSPYGPKFRHRAKNVLFSLKNAILAKERTLKLNQIDIVNYMGGITQRSKSNPVEMRSNIYDRAGEMLVATSLSSRAIIF